LRYHLAWFPEPILTFETYDSFILSTTIFNESDKVKFQRALIRAVPKLLQVAFRQLLSLLQQLLQNSERNKLTVRFLCDTFGPYFLRPREISYYMQSDKETVTQLIQFFLKHVDDLAVKPTLV